VTVNPIHKQTNTQILPYSLAHLYWTIWLPIPEDSNLHKIKGEKTYLSKNQWEDRLAIVWE